MKKIIVTALTVSLLLTGCGASKNMAANEPLRDKYQYAQGAGDAADDLNGIGEADYVKDEAMESVSAPAEAGESAVAAAGGAPASKTEQGTGGKINREMLVYRGRLNIDTLDFDKSVKDFKSMLTEKGGFIDSETYTDNFSMGGYYEVDESRKRNCYTASARIPSAEFETLMNSSTNLGDVRSRSSNATNVTQQYGTYKAELEVYETKYERYLKMLENATEDEYALQIENELFNIQLVIADLKSSITNIDNDVAYSYIDITIQEVSKYEEQPAATDTFADRLVKTCKDAWRNFLTFVEDLLFFVIMNFYLIIIVVAVILIIRAVRKKKKAEKAPKKEDKTKKNKIKEEIAEPEEEDGEATESEEA